MPKILWKAPKLIDDPNTLKNISVFSIIANFKITFLSAFFGGKINDHFVLKMQKILTLHFFVSILTKKFSDMFL